MGIELKDLYISILRDKGIIIGRPIWYWKDYYYSITLKNLMKHITHFLLKDKPIMDEQLKHLYIKMLRYKWIPKSRGRFWKSKCRRDYYFVILREPDNRDGRVASFLLEKPYED